MNFKTDFLVEDYSGLCWFQARVATIIISLGLALAFGFTLTGISGRILLGAILAIVLYPIIYFLRKRGVRRRAERRFAAVPTSDELELILNEDEILQYSAKGEIRLPWADVYAVRESKACYYVFLAKGKAFYFPKRSFESETHREAFLEYVNKYSPLGKVKLKSGK